MINTIPKEIDVVYWQENSLLHGIRENMEMVGNELMKAAS